ncbi:unnamed protein product, partial [Prorocentrum cordatum]
LHRKNAGGAPLRVWTGRALGGALGTCWRLPGGLPGERPALRSPPRRLGGSPPFPTPPGAPAAASARPRAREAPHSSDALSTLAAASRTAWSSAGSSRAASTAPMNGEA